MIVRMLQVCLNGARDRAECPHLPVTPDELAIAARDAVAAGAQDIHLHPKNRDGGDSLEPGHVEAALNAVRAAVPGVPVGVTTGAWAQPDAELRARLVRSWTVLPDHASVNWHENGATTVARALLDRGIGIEAGIHSGTDAVEHFLAWPRSHRVLRVLAEVTDPDPLAAPAAALALLDTLTTRTTLPILLHGEGAAAWAVLHAAATRQLDTRIGLEDVLNLPDGAPAPSNASLVRTARVMLQSPA